MTKTPWFDVEPRDAVNVRLPSPDIRGPYNEEGEPCPWPWDPPQLAGRPIGQYHCPYCLAMVIAGMDHIDYGPKDGHGLNELDRDYLDYCHQPHPADLERWANEGGPA